MRTPLILVVDDDRDTRELYRVVLSLSGFDVAEAGDVRRAVEIAAAARPDVTLTDWRLPDGDGFVLADRLRAIPSTRRTQLMAITGLTMDSETLVRARQAGFTRVLQKPADPDAIVAAVNESLDATTARELPATAAASAGASDSLTRDSWRSTDHRRSVRR